MAGLPWIELHTDLPRHRKSVDLGFRLGDPRAWTYMAELWLWAADQLPDGRLSGDNAGRVLEHGAGWRGEPGKFFECALQAGFIERDGDGFSLHGWAEMASAHIAKREADAARQKARREKLQRNFSEPVTSDKRPRDVRVTSSGHPRESRRNKNNNNNKETIDRTNDFEARFPGVTALEKGLRESLAWMLGDKIPIAKADRAKPGKVAAARDALEAQVTRLGVETAVAVCRDKALAMKAEEGLYPSVLSFYVRTLAAAQPAEPDEREIWDRINAESLRKQHEEEAEQRAAWEARQRTKVEASAT